MPFSSKTVNLACRPAVNLLSCQWNYLGPVLHTILKLVICLKESSKVSHMQSDCSLLYILTAAWRKNSQWWRPSLPNNCWMNIYSLWSGTPLVSYQTLARLLNIEKCLWTTSTYQSIIRGFSSVAARVTVAALMSLSGHLWWLLPCSHWSCKNE